MADRRWLIVSGLFLVLLVLSVVRAVPPATSEPASLDTRVAFLERQVEGLLARLEAYSYDERTQTVLVTGNLQIANGISRDDSCSDDNDLGNLIIGYNHDGRTFGSHNFVQGDGNILHGNCNFVSSWGTQVGGQAFAGGGYGHRLFGEHPSAVGGVGSVIHTSAYAGTALGGQANQLFGNYTTASGGYQNRLTGPWSWTGGGNHGTADGVLAVAIGGWFAHAEANRSVAIGSLAYTPNDDQVASCTVVDLVCRDGSQRSRFNLDHVPVLPAR